MRIIDWDTIEIQFLQNLKKEKLRLIWVDTPEVKHPRLWIQKYWIQAYNFTKQNLEGREVFIEIDPNNLRDSYSRLLWFVILDWNNFNKKLIRKGYAKAYLKYEFKYNSDFEKAEKQAKKEKIWIWTEEITKEEKNAIISQNDLSKNIEYLEDPENLIISEKDVNEYFFSGSLFKTRIDKIYKQEKKKYSNELEIVDKIEPIIKLQWKIWKNKRLIWNVLKCIWTCKVNFDWSKSIWKNLKYLWNFWNGKTFDWKNPWYIKYEVYWKYKIDLKILTSSWEEKISTFFIDFIPEIKKNRIKKTITSSQKNKNKVLKISKFPGEKLNKIQIHEKEIRYEKKENNNWIFYYFLIIMFSFILVFILLKKIKIL